MTTEMAAPPGMRWVPGGTFRMGSKDFYPEERPVRDVSADGFWIDEHPVTAADFRRFVRASGYVTIAERTPDAADYPDADPALLVPGSLVFRPTDGPVDLDDYTQWWEYLPGATWRRPGGPGTTINGRDRHPVVHVASSRLLRTTSSQRRSRTRSSTRMRRWSRSASSWTGAGSSSGS